MKVLAINGSSRKDGNTADMLRLVIGELDAAGYETEMIQLTGETINPARHVSLAQARGIACSATINSKPYTRKWQMQMP